MEYTKNKSQSLNGTKRKRHTIALKWHREEDKTFKEQIIAFSVAHRKRVDKQITDHRPPLAPRQKVDRPRTNSTLQVVPIRRTDKQSSDQRKEDKQGKNHSLPMGPT